MCSVYHPKCEGETTGSVAGTMTLLCMVTRSGAQHVCVCVCVWVCECVSISLCHRTEKFTDLLRTECPLPSQHGVTPLKAVHYYSIQFDKGNKLSSASSLSLCVCLCAVCARAWVNGRRWQKGEKIAEVLFQFGSVCICSFMCEHLISKCHTDFQLTKRSKGNTAALEGAQLDLLLTATLLV